MYILEQTVSALQQPLGGRMGPFLTAGFQPLTQARQSRSPNETQREELTFQPGFVNHMDTSIFSDFTHGPQTRHEL